MIEHIATAAAELVPEIEVPDDVEEEAEEEAAEAEEEEEQGEGVADKEEL